METMNQLLTDVHEQLAKASHPFECPRHRDDFECNCGLSDVRARVAAQLAEPEEDEIERLTWEVERAWYNLHNALKQRERDRNAAAGRRADEAIKAGHNPF